MSTANQLLPGSWATYFYMGKAELFLGHTDAAVPLLQKASSLNPDDAGSLYLLARAFKSQGKAQDATKALQRVYALHKTALEAERRALREAGIVKDAGLDSEQ